MCFKITSRCCLWFGNWFRFLLHLSLHQNSCLFLNFFLVIIKHFPTLLCHSWSCIVIILGNVSQNFHKRWNCKSLIFCSLNFQNWRTLINIQESFNHKVLASINKALSEFLQINKTRSSLVEIFNVLSSWCLSLFLKSFIVLIQSRFMVVNVWVVLTNLSNKNFSMLMNWMQECFNDLKDFLLCTLWKFYVKLSWNCNH